MNQIQMNSFTGKIYSRPGNVIIDQILFNRVLVP